MAANGPERTELNVRFDRRRLAEHLGLQLTGLIPCWLPTHSGVEGKNPPSALSY